MILGLSSCNNENSFYATKIIDGNTIVLSNGITVNLIDVQDNQGNIKILEHYLTGNILLYSENHEEISQFSSDIISSYIYNSDGDCLNELLVGVNKISDNDKPLIVEDPVNDNKTIVKFEHESGVLKIPIEINGVELYFIFDTGASLITISITEAVYLYSLGKLTDEDFIGKSQFTDANGDISEGSIINLRSVKIGNRLLNDVQACVIEGQNAPLLFGQSALKKFGKVSINYERNEILFE
jgi:aspartyl protease family protein